MTMTDAMRRKMKDYIQKADEQKEKNEKPGLTSKPTFSESKMNMFKRASTTTFRRLATIGLTKPSKTRNLDLNDKFEEDLDDAHDKDNIPQALQKKPTFQENVGKSFFSRGLTLRANEKQIANNQSGIRPLDLQSKLAKGVLKKASAKFKALLQKNQSEEGDQISSIPEDEKQISETETLNNSVHEKDAKTTEPKKIEIQNLDQSQDDTSNVKKSQVQDQLLDPTVPSIFQEVEKSNGQNQISSQNLITIEDKEQNESSKNLKSSISSNNDKVIVQEQSQEVQTPISIPRNKLMLPSDKNPPTIKLISNGSGLFQQQFYLINPSVVGNFQPNYDQLLPDMPDYMRSKGITSSVRNRIQQIKDQARQSQENGSSFSIEQSNDTSNSRQMQLGLQSQLLQTANHLQEVNNQKTKTPQLGANRQMQRKTFRSMRLSRIGQVERRNSANTQQDHLDQQREPNLLSAQSSLKNPKNTIVSNSNTDSDNNNQEKHQDSKYMWRRIQPSEKNPLKKKFLNKPISKTNDQFVEVAVKSTNDKESVLISDIQRKKSPKSGKVKKKKAQTSVYQSPRDTINWDGSVSNRVSNLPYGGMSSVIAPKSSGATRAKRLQLNLKNYNCNNADQFSGFYTQRSQTRNGKSSFTGLRPKNITLKDKKKHGLFKEDYNMNSPAVKSCEDMNPQMIQLQGNYLIKSPKEAFALQSMIQPHEKSYFHQSAQNNLTQSQMSSEYESKQIYGFYC